MRLPPFPGWLLCACLALGSARAFAQEPPLAVTAALQSAVDRHPLHGAKVGVVARRLSDGREVFSFHGNEMLELASNTKLFTTAAALWKLGADYEFRTTLIANGQIQDGVLQGDLVVVGSGDPSFSGRVHPSPMTVPREFAKAVQAAGIRQITGGLVMDDRLFDRVYRAPGWPKAEWQWWYAAPISALSFNDNCADVSVTGADRPGASAVLEAKPPFMQLINRCSTVAKGKPANVSFKRDPSGAVVVEGNVESGRTRTEAITVNEPETFIGQVLLHE